MSVVEEMDSKYDQHIDYSAWQQVMNVKISIIKISDESKKIILKSI